MKLSIHTWLLGGALACAAAVTACDPSVGPPASTLAPAPNFTMRVDAYAFSENRVRIPGTISTRWVTVSPDTSSYAGRANVMRLVSRTDTSRTRSGDTMYVHIADNGDVEIFQPHQQIDGLFRIRERWIPFPIGSKANAVRTTLVDTTFLRTDTTVYRYKESMSASFLGTERLDTGITSALVMRGDLVTVKARVTQTVEETRGFGIRTPIVIETTIWYSPKLNSLVRHETWITRPSVPGVGVGMSVAGYLQR
jgi:hypothetical protein